MKAWPLLGITLVETFLLLAHLFLFHTWSSFFLPGPSLAFGLRVAILILAFSFIVASLLSFRFYNPVVAFFYKIAAVWLGLLNFLFWAACLTWPAWYAWRALRPGSDPASARPFIAGICIGVALLTSIYGIVNARRIQIRRFPISLPGLPPSWHGRRALLMSDLHLGNINGVNFSRRMTALANSLQPDIVLIPGDLFDGTKADLDKLVAPFKQLSPPLGTYFSTGNHEEFSGVEHYLDAITRSGIKVLNNEKTLVDGLHIAGVPFADSTSPIRLRTTLEGLHIAPHEACILLNHMPSRLPIVERAGVSLQLSGHTHGGQFFPFTWLTRRIFGKFTHGLNRFGNLQVYTSTGAGTWGPPMRVGTHPEIVIIEFN